MHPLTHLPNPKLALLSCLLKITEFSFFLLKMPKQFGGRCIFRTTPFKNKRLMLDDVSCKMLHNLTYFCSIQKHTLHGIFYRFSFCAIFYFLTSFCQALNLLFLKSDYSIGRQYVVLLELVISVSFLKIYESGDQNYI